MLYFVLGVLVGGMIIALTPAKYEDQLRLSIIRQWQKITQRG